ncbi:MAG: ISAs1 family transposase [Tannerellaceae bacterium]|jgi:predicted transposase YbfD/YdcC|nr:ISAs1 family transposase [Tannerellaceae bacterium]
MCSPIKYFTELTDPRIDRSKEHLMEDIIFITIAAVICGAETWNDIENYGRYKESWLRQYLQLPNGIPSDDTFKRFFSALNPEEFEKTFIQWVSEVAEMTKGEVVSIEGKSLRVTREGSQSKWAVHIVSAWANTNRLSMGEVKVADKSNEITAIPKLLEVLAMQGYTVTLDAMGCQKEIAEKIIKKGADYISVVKDNQGYLEEDVKRTERFCLPLEE